MPASLTFNDGSGDQTITPSPSLSRLNRWIPLPVVVGESAIAVGDGRGYKWAHRTDYTAGFELPHLAIADDAVLQDFLEHANAYGLFTITTGDSESNVYDDVQVSERNWAYLTQQVDGAVVEYTLHLPAIVHMAVVPTPLRVVYQ